jgi:hypothetical protein
VRPSYESRLLAHYLAAQPHELSAGDGWYAGARRTVRALAREFGVTERCAAGVIAALSPRVKWEQNVRLACDALANRPRIIGSLRANEAKALRIRSGEAPLVVLRGPKVRAFYRALIGDESSGVIDVWMARAMRLRRLTERTYLRAVEAMRRVAAYVGTTVARLQATVWTVVRGSAI